MTGQSSACANLRRFKYIAVFTGVVVAGVAGAARAQGPCGLFNVGNVSFRSPDDFADDAIPVPGSGALEFRCGAANLREAIVGTDLVRHVTAAGIPDLPTPKFDVLFTNNEIVNRPGPDFVVFELSAPNAFEVSILTATGYAGPIVVIGQNTGLSVSNEHCPGPDELNVAYVDLSDFGLPPFFRTQSIRIGLPILNNRAADVSAIGVLTVCDDGDPCTRDQCKNGVCVSVLIDTDGDGIPDCHDACPEVPGIPPDGCPEFTCNAGGMYAVRCAPGQPTTFPIMVTSAGGNPNLPVSTSWTTDCPGAVIADPNSPSTTMTIPASSGCPLICSVSVTCTAGGGDGGGGGTSASSTAIVNLFTECNGNGIPDNEDIAAGTSRDCNSNRIPDECDVDPTDPDGNGQVSKDCNRNGIPDECDLDPTDPDGNGMVSKDCNRNGIPDECDIDPTDPDGNGQVSKDCNRNGIPDECDLNPSDPDGNGQVSKDCNRNGIPDECDLNPSDPDGNGQVSRDCNRNGIPDECDLNPNDPDGNGQVSRDCNGNGIPDECDLDPTDPDRNGQVSRDCNHNGIPDECDINPADPDRNGSISADCNRNGIPDECELDPNAPGGLQAADCNHNGVPDICDVDPNDPDGNGRVSGDCNRNGIPDECEPDSDGDGVIDDCEEQPAPQPPPPATGPSGVLITPIGFGLLFRFCGMGMIVALPLTLLGIAVMKFARRRRS